MFASLLLGQVVSVGSNYIDIACVDMVDGTPVLDVKPYIPYDIVPHDRERRIEMAALALDEVGRPLQATQLRVPVWIYEADVPLRPVQFSEGARQALSLLQDRGGFRLCAGRADAARLVTEVLRQDIRSCHQGRGGGGEDAAGRTDSAGGSSSNSSNSGSGGQGLYECKLDSFLVKFRTLETCISVEEISLL